MAATRLHRQLGTKSDAPVDVLGIARDLDLYLMMQPLDNLYGFYVRAEHAAGIVVNSLHPESLQRFTLAHEIGHHVLGHEGTTDGPDSLNEFDSDSTNEIAAQAFAASLLMPQPLVNRILKDLPKRHPAPTDVYLFSRQLGVSYTAGVWTLQQRGLLTVTEARRYIGRGAAAAKTELRGGENVSDARADVWILDQHNNDLDVLCRVGDEIRVQLPENTSSGNAWLIRSPAASGIFDQPRDTGAINFVEVNDAVRPPAESPIIEVVLDEHHDRAVDPIGSGSQNGEEELPLDELEVELPGHDRQRTIVFVPRRAGNLDVKLDLARPWDPLAVPADEFQLSLRVRERRLSEPGLLAPVADEWIARAGQPA